MKKTKKIVSLLLSVLMVVSCVSVFASVTASADEVTPIVAGSDESLFGTKWDGENTANAMTLNTASGKYEMSYTTTEALGQVQLKVVVDGTWYGDPQGNNVAFNVNGAGTFTVIFDNDTKEITVSGSNVGAVVFTVEAMYAVGNGDGEDDPWMNGQDWDPAAAVNKMTEIETGVYSITFEDVEQFDNYECKFATNGDWSDNWGILDSPDEVLQYGVWMNAVYNSQRNINVEVPEDGTDVTLKIDIRNFDPETKQGAKFMVIVGDEPDPTVCTINVAVPTGTMGAWDAAELYYNSVGSMTGATFIPMTDTGNTMDVMAAGLKTIGAGHYKVYAAALTQAQADAIDASELVGFRNTNTKKGGRTGTNTNVQVLKASDTLRGRYNKTQARPVSAFDGKTFVIDGCYMADAEKSTYKGHWATTGDTINLNYLYTFVPITGKGAWSGVELYYGNSASNLKTITFKQGKNTRDCNARSLTTVESGAWGSFYKKLTLDQFIEIDNAKIVGFRNTSGAGSTPATADYELSKAPTTLNGSYSTTKIPLERRCGKRFIITGCADAANEQSTYTGFWT